MKRKYFKWYKQLNRNMATVQQPQQTTTQLEFHQAMADFKTMFPDMEDEVIEVISFELNL